jgi:uncharacterized tellurite resistance protein B-like protein
LERTLFRSIKTLISDLMGGARPRGQDQGYKLATAALLTRVATVHNEMSVARRERLHTLLKSAFGLDDSTAAQLIEESVAVNRNAIDLYHFTRELNEVLDDEGRRRTVRLMWEIVYADGNVNEFEANIIWRASDLLGVSSRQRVELRQLVSAESTALSRTCVGGRQSLGLATIAGN